MEKLELKHIVGYLPYGLKMINEFEDIWNINMSAFSANLDKVITSSKPILRPLSDLTKEIEVNGEKFVPEEYFNNNCNKYYLPEYWNAVLFIQAENIFSVNYAIIQKLYEWHFDIHDLIGKDLAIDINTLTK